MEWETHGNGEKPKKSCLVFSWAASWKLLFLYILLLVLKTLSLSPTHPQPQTDRVSSTKTKNGRFVLWVSLRPSRVKSSGPFAYAMRLDDEDEKACMYMPHTTTKKAKAKQKQQNEAKIRWKEGKNYIRT